MCVFLREEYQKNTLLKTELGKRETRIAQGTKQLNLKYESGNICPRFIILARLHIKRVQKRLLRRKKNPPLFLQKRGIDTRV